ncbi:MAG: tRNA (adenosine(37)-N6)-threonylcarbamoyltransferase complex dimerization subunit type 1 TsaB [Verrucomicrobiota bacterium]
MKDALTLCLDASGSDAGSWAMVKGDQILLEETFSGRASSQLFVSLEKHREQWINISQIFVGIGPGSFSGIRVTIAAAQGLDLALGCKIIPVYSSNALAYQHRHVSFLGVFAPARKEEYFAAFYEKGKLSRPPQIIHAADLENSLSKCSLAVSADAIHGIAQQTPILASNLALHALEFGMDLNLPLEPFYIAATPTV